MISLTVVIITRNEENNIAGCIHSAKLLSDDVVVVDAGSTDNTVALAALHGARTFVVAWEGYGHSRNFGAAKAKHDWILALDADERVSSSLVAAIQKITDSHPETQFRFRRKNYLGDKELHFGNPGFERVSRIYQRHHTAWDNMLVHERLVADHGQKKNISGHIDHFGIKSSKDYREKVQIYAQLSAEKYFTEGRKAGWLKRLGSPLFNSIKSYVFQLGFLDGRNGWIVAKTIAYYSWLKYYYLRQMYAAHFRSNLRFNRNMKTA